MSSQPTDKTQKTPLSVRLEWWWDDFQHRRRTGGAFFEIFAHEHALVLNRNHYRVAEMQWSDMREAYLAQADMLGYELINLILTDQRGQQLLLDELMPGFESLRRQADRHFPGFYELAETFAANALGRFSEVEPLTIDLMEGEPAKKRILPRAIQPTPVEPAWLDQPPGPITSGLLWRLASFGCATAVLAFASYAGADDPPVFSYLYSWILFSLPIIAWPFVRKFSYTIQDQAGWLPLRRRVSHLKWFGAVLAVSVVAALVRRTVNSELTSLQFAQTYAAWFIVLELTGVGVGFASRAIDRANREAM